MLVKRGSIGTQSIGALVPGTEAAYYLDPVKFPNQPGAIEFLDRQTPVDTQPCTADITRLIGRPSIFGFIRYEAETADGLPYTVRTLSDPPESLFDNLPDPLMPIMDVSIISVEETNHPDIRPGNYGEVHFKPRAGNQIHVHPLSVQYYGRYILPMATAGLALAKVREIFLAEQLN